MSDLVRNPEDRFSQNEAPMPLICYFVVFFSSRFVQYVATIGGYSDHPGCFKPYTRDQSVILQYSNDGGVSWHTLHTLDHTSYVKPRRDYIKLPQASRTTSTRIRWWQPLAEPRSRVQPTWALDNVFIGVLIIISTYNVFCP